MKRSRLIPILKSFSKEEIKEFEKFLSSPFFGCKQFVLNLYKVLIRYYPEFKDKDISKDKLFGKLYKEREFNDLLFRRMVSDLIRFSEEYLLYKNFKKKEIFRNTCLLNELALRNLDAAFTIKHNNIMKRLDELPFADPIKLQEIFHIQTEMKNFRTHLRDELMNKSYLDSVEAFTVLYIRIAFAYLNHINTFKGEYGKTSEIVMSFFKHFDEQGFISDAGKFNEKYSAYLKIINCCMLIIKDENDKTSYTELKELMAANSEKLSGHERLSCYVIMLRFCNTNNLKHDNEYLNESFEINETILKEKLFLEYSPYLQLSFCRNHVIKCKILNNFDAIKLFIKNFKEYFNPEYKDEFIYYCGSLLLFEEGNFDRSIQQASKADLNKAVFRKDLRILKIKNYYEKNYMDSLLSEIDSFRHFNTSNETINPEIILKAKNFLSYISALAKLKGNKDPQELQMLKNKLEKDSKVNEKKWLLDKISEIS